LLKTRNKPYTTTLGKISNNILEQKEITKSELNRARKEASINVILSAFGPIGTAIQESLFGIGDRIRNNRIENYLIELEPRLKKIENLSIPEKYFESIEFYDLNYKTLKSVSETSDKLKYKILSNIFCESINPESDWENDLKNIFIQIITEFSLNHFYVLKFLITKKGIFKIKSYENLHLEFTEYIKNKKIDVYQFRLYCREIENKSLIRFSSNLYEIGSDGGFVESESSDKIESIILTSFGKKFISMIE
jgi:hypothetical protein